MDRTEYNVFIDGYNLANHSMLHDLGDSDHFFGSIEEFNVTGSFQLSCGGNIPPEVNLSVPPAVKTIRYWKCVYCGSEYVQDKRPSSCYNRCGGSLFINIAEDIKVERIK